jgi:transcriptional regulator GlxA family with amidase domain
MTKTDNWTIVVQRTARSAFDVRDAQRLLSSGMPIRRVATELDVSVATLRHSFVRHYGVTPKRWVAENRLRTSIAERLREVEPLIASGKLSLARIAAMTGFGSHQRFGVAFKRVYGISPTQWRSVTKSRERHS